MNLQILLVVHTLPLWFLVFSLFLPRIALALLWFEGAIAPFHLHGLIPLVVAILIPRLLILYMIYLDQGIGLWFVIHLVVAVLAWAGGGNYYSRRRRYRRD